MGEAQDNDVMRVLIATDNHLGYMENDPLRREDSFEAFEEIFCEVCLYGALVPVQMPPRITFGARLMI